MQHAACQAPEGRKSWAARLFETNAAFAFWAGFGMTLLVHAFEFLNHVNNIDQIQNVYALPASFSLGRWLLDDVLEIGSRLSMPWLNGLLLALAMGATVALAADLFRLKRRFVIVLTAWALVSFPAFISMVTFIHVADSYGISILLATLSVWLANRWKWGTAGAVVCLVLSMGIYQVYWTFALALFCAKGLLVLLEGRRTDREVLFLALRYGIVLLGGMIGYLVVSRIALAAKGSQLAGYMGVDAMGQIPLRLIPHLMKKSYLTFFSTLFSGARLMGGASGPWVMGAVLAFLAGSVMVGAFAKKHTVVQRVLMAGITAMLPLLMNAVHLMNPASVHGVMQFSPVAALLLACALAQMWLDQAPDQVRAMKIAAMAAACLIGIYSFSGTVYANQVYYVSSLEFNAMSEYMSRVVYRLEAHEDYTRETPVLFVGSVAAGGYGNVPFWKMLPSHRDVKPFGMLKADSRIRSFLFSYLELTFPMPKAETALALQESETVKAMPSYPNEGCVQLVDGVLVVKMGE